MQTIRSTTKLIGMLTRDTQIATACLSKERIDTIQINQRAHRLKLKIFIFISSFLKKSQNQKKAADQRRKQKT